MTEKETLYAHCLQYVEQRISRIQAEITRVQASANEETKSSAGDKYETGRAMAQNEIERNTLQRLEAERLQSVLTNINQSNSFSVGAPGALVTTSKGVFYIAISLGAVPLQGKTYFIVSADSPIGKLLIGKKVGDLITWNGNQHEIKKVE
jgi:transcription elongation GreA/GreB family factor